jgi:hypothetical protein
MNLRALVVVGLIFTGCAPVETGSVETGSVETDSAGSSSKPSVTARVKGASANFAAVSQQLKSDTTSQLCAAYVLRSTKEQSHLMIEAELAVRGVFQCGGTNIGIKSAAQVGVSRYNRLGGNNGSIEQDYDCSDFSSGATVQRFFLAAGGPSSDPYNLDGDGDGHACEWGAQIRQIAARRVRTVPTYIPTTPRYATGICHVGPRGGSYTVTSGGRKNYGGC